MTNTTYHKETTMTTRTAAQLRTDVLNATRAHMHAEQLASILNDARHQHPTNHFIAEAYNRAEQLCAETEEDMNEALLDAHNHGIDI